MPCPGDITIIYKRFLIGYLIITSFTALYFIVLYRDNMLPFLGYALCIFIVGELLFLLLLVKLEYRVLEPFLPLGIIILSLSFYPILLFHHICLGKLSIFIFYSLALLTIYVIVPRRLMIRWAAYIFILLLISFLLEPVSGFLSGSSEDYFRFFNTEEKPGAFSVVQKNFSLAGAVFFPFIMVCYNLYYIDLIHRMEINRLLSGPASVSVSVSKSASGEKEKTPDRRDRLYQNILDYFQSETKPYTNPDLNISQVTLELHTNIAYISQAIRNNRDMNFNTFVNTYRVESAKAMIARNKDNNYTMEYIYTSSGFRNQSTFNKVFKEIEGVTPSEYYKKIEN